MRTSLTDALSPATRTRYGIPLLLVVTLAGASVLFGCQTPVLESTSKMNQPELFQAARHAVGQRNYQAAMEFYRDYLERFPSENHPDELEHNLWAEYEIAFLHHKDEDDQTAIELLGRLVAKYDGEGSEDLPPAPGRLARRVLEELQAPQM